MELFKNFDALSKQMAFVESVPADQAGNIVLGATQPASLSST